MIRALLFSALFVAVASTATPARAACTDAPVKVRAPTMSTSELEDFNARFSAALVRLCRWWDSDFSGSFDIDIDESRGPSMALVPAWRGNRGHMLFRGTTVRLGNAAISHEITHVLAPNANRFLAEGLAVYAHQSQHGEPAYPNFGKDLDALAKPLAAKADIAALDRLASPDRLQLKDLDERSAYIVAGSFVGFLIERHTMELFRELYALTPLAERRRNAGDVERWRKVYGVPLQNLIDEWRASLAG